MAIVLRNKIDYLRTSLFLFDTIVIGLYTLVGIEKGINAHLHPVISIALGTITASFGGVMRDIYVMKYRLFSERKSMLQLVF